MSMKSPAQDPEILTETRAATVAVLPDTGRLSLRARKPALPALGAALGLTLPERIGQRAAGAGLEALCLGPDEWVLLAAPDKVADLLGACARVELPHSLVDISGREVTFRITGPRAAELLSIGCPRDIATIAEGAGRRTVFDGVTVVLWRDGENSFRMDVWNSFAPHLRTLLDIGARELAAEPV